MEHFWEPGENCARCRVPYTRPCEVSPGKHCQCGFWALWSPLQCIAKAREPGRRAWNAIGLISAWGTVALHGDEGFRAEHASVLCLFTDWAWSVPLPDPKRGRLPAWWHDVLCRWCSPSPGNIDPPPGRPLVLERAASWYGVPLVSLKAALELGLLAEWGVPLAQVEEARRWVAAGGT